MDQIITAGVEFANIVPEVWSRRFYDTLLASLPFASIIDDSYEGEIQNLGDTVKISTFPEFDEALVLPEGSRNDAEALTPTQQDLVINKRVVKDFIITSRAQLQSLPHMDKLRELAIFAINKKIQSLIIELSVPSSSSPDHQLAYDSGTTLALSDILEAKELLDTANVPTSDRHLVLGAAQMNDIFNITGFTSSDFLLSGAPIQTGQLPPALVGFIPQFTTEVGAVSHFFHSSYQTMASQQGIAVSEHNLGVNGVRGTRINVDWLGGFKQLDDVRIVEKA